MSVLSHVSRRRALSGLAALALTIGGLTTAAAATQTISINPSQIGATLNDYDNGGTCPEISGYDVWHFVAPGSSVFTSVDVRFTGAAARYTVIGGDPNSGDKHAWVYTAIGAGAVLASGTAEIDGSGSQFVLSHTCHGSGEPAKAETTLVTQASTSTPSPVEGDGSTASDLATVTAPAGADPTGTVTWSYCVAADATPVWSDCRTSAIAIPGSVDLDGGTDATDGVATALLADWPIPGVGYYLFHAEYGGSADFDGSSDASGVSESFRMAPAGTVQPSLRYADMPRWIETGASSRKCPSAAVGGKQVGNVTVGDVVVPLKSATYRKGGVFHPPASAKIATISRRHQPLSATEGTTFIAWHVRWNKGCNGALNVLNTKPAGYTFTTTDADGQVKSWVVQDNFLVKKGHYQRSWFTWNGDRKLVLITCADLSGGKFRKNRVIIATPAPPA